ncbi:MAG: Holliday junction branch migration protein RuvA [SAR202 cluster bacterium Io17-Chloro-G3]|nr:MAG: Holliday junction branch migration protein RuvA [SAR202 cluster bacterium Io17-Chloro-G3]
MITSIFGVLQSVADDHVVISVGGIGFQIFVPPSVTDTIGVIGHEVRLNTSLLMRDDVPFLYGFPTMEGKRLFDSLLAVSGVGPRYALAILSTMTPDEAAVAIVSGNAELLSVVPGIGKRTAARIVIDLQAKLQKDWKAAGLDVSPTNTDLSAALQALGYSPVEIQNSVSNLADLDELPLEEQVRLALRDLARG